MNRQKKYRIVILLLFSMVLLYSRYPLHKLENKPVIISEKHKTTAPIPTPHLPISSEDKTKQEAAAHKALETRLYQHVIEAQKYARTHNLDDEHAVLIDFSIHSGKQRFFVYNLKQKKVEFSSLVAHGYGKENFRSTQSDIVFSNVEGSYASSLGKYKIGTRSYSQYGINIHYKLHGLEKSNDNAFRRIIVLHSYKDFPSEILYPRHLPLGYSQGCPVIDDNSMKKMDILLKNKKKPVLLWTYH